MGFCGILWVFTGILLGFYGILLGFDGKFMGFLRDNGMFMGFYCGTFMGNAWDDGMIDSIEQINGG